METETIDRLFLELSQVTKARTKRELELRRRIRAMTPQTALSDEDCGLCIERLAISLQETKAFMERTGLSDQLKNVYQHLSKSLFDFEFATHIDAREAADNFEKRCLKNG